MKQTTATRIGLLLLIALAAALTATKAAADVTIPDPGLESTLRDTLGLGPEVPLTKSALAGLTVLNAYDKGIVNLTGLEYCTGLTKLDLNFNHYISRLSR